MVQGVAGERIVPGAVVVDDQGAIDAGNGQGIAADPINKDDIAMPEIKRTRSVRAEVHLKVGKSSMHDKSCAVWTGAIRQMRLIQSELNLTNARGSISRRGWIDRRLYRRHWRLSRPAWREIKRGRLCRNWPEDTCNWFILRHIFHRRRIEEVAADTDCFRTGIRNDFQLIRRENNQMAATASRAGGNHAGSGCSRRQPRGGIEVATFQGCLNIGNLGCCICYLVSPLTCCVDILVQYHLRHPAQVKMCVLFRQQDGNTAIRSSNNTLIRINRAVGCEQALHPGR